MTPILGFLLLVTIAFVGKVLISPRIRKNHPFLLALSASGIPYILIGVMLGPRGFDVLNEEILAELHPLISLGLGWVGFLFGIQLQWRNIRRFPANYLLFTSLQSLIALIIIGGVIVLVLIALEIPTMQAVEYAVIFAIIGSMTAPMALARMIISHKLRGKLVHLIQFSSSLDAFWGIVFIGGFFIMKQSLLPSGITIPWLWLVIVLVLGMSLGFSFIYLLRLRFEPQELLLLILGLIIFVSGIGFYLHLSPIFLTMVVGVVIAQFSLPARRLSRVLLFAEKPVYLMMLIFAGAWWNVPATTQVWIIIVFLIARLAGKICGGWLASRTVSMGFPVPGNIGIPLLAFGGTALAVAFNYLLFNVNPMGDLVISATIIGIVVFDELAMWGTRRVLPSEDYQAEDTR